MHLDETVFPKLLMLLSREVLSSPLPFRPTQVLHKKNTALVFHGRLGKEIAVSLHHPKLQHYRVFTSESPAIQSGKT